MRKLQKSKKRHEAKKFLRECVSTVEKYSEIIAYVQSYTAKVREDGFGYFLVPAIAKFERITPASEPTGITFIDGSFLAIKELFLYDYHTDEATEPQIGFIEYSYHYQRPTDQLFFRYDFHPNIGEADTHPIYHLHAGGWRRNIADFPLVPRFPVMYTSLDDVLEIIRITYF